MTSIRIYPRYSKTKQSGQIQLYLRITQNRESRYVSLGVAIAADDWNEHTSRLKLTTTNAVIITAT